MASRKKPRGLRVIKPILPDIYRPGIKVQYRVKPTDDPKLAVCAGSAIWSQDGYWELDAYDEGNITLIWHPKKQHWIKSL